jgi:hypothetical protein
MAAWGWFDVRQRGQVDPNQPWVHKTDFTVYTEAGAAFFDGRPPYEVTNPRGWGYLYPPLFAMLLAPLHALDPRAQVLVWFAASVLMTWGCYRQCVRIGELVAPRGSKPGTFGSFPNGLAVAAAAAALLPALNCLQRGQVSLLKLYLLLLGFRLIVEHRGLARAVAGGLVLAAAVTLKITPLVPTGFLLCWELAAAWHAERPGRFRLPAAAMAGTAAGMVLWLLLVPAALVGWRANLAHLDTWWRTIALNAESVSTTDFAGDSTSVRNQSFTNAAHRLGNWTH